MNDGVCEDDAWSNSGRENLRMAHRPTIESSEDLLVLPVHHWVLAVRANT